MTEATAATPALEVRGAKRQELTGVVTSSKMQKTIVVKVTRTVQHRMYQRVVRIAKKYYAHDEKGAAKVGTNRGRTPAVQAEALALGRSVKPFHARRVEISPGRGESNRHGSDADVADGSRQFGRATADLHSSGGRRRGAGGGHRRRNHRGGKRSGAR
jgi:DNA-binding protein H-NS